MWSKRLEDSLDYSLPSSTEAALADFYTVLGLLFFSIPLAKNVSIFTMFLRKPHCDSVMLLDSKSIKFYREFCYKLLNWMALVESIIGNAEPMILIIDLMF